MKHITRKKFLGILAAAASSTVVGSVKNDDGLDDIYDDKHYVLKGGPYKDTGSVGASGKSWRADLLEIMHNEDHYLQLERFIENVERQHFYFSVSLYNSHSSEEYRKYGHKKIFLTRTWLMNFYTKHLKESYAEK